MSKRIIHCWKDEQTYIEEKFGWMSPEHLVTWHDDYAHKTCMLESGHEDEHLFLNDANIGIKFLPTKAGGPRT